MHRNEPTGMYDASISAWGNYGLPYEYLVTLQNELYAKNLKKLGNSSRTG